MDLTGALRPGEEVPFSLELQGGGSLECEAVVRSFRGAEEEYDAGDGS